MHVVVARPQKLAPGRVRRTPGHQQDGNTAAAKIVKRHRGIGGTGIDMDDDALAAPRGDGIACRHVHSGDLVRTKDSARRLAAVALEAGHCLDERRVIGAEVAEEVVDSDLVQAFEEIMRRRMAGFVAVHDRLSR